MASSTAAMMFLSSLLLGMVLDLTLAQETTKPEVIAVAVLVPLFLIIAVLIVVFVVCRRKVLQEKREEIFSGSGDSENDAIDTGLSNGYVDDDIMEKEVAAVDVMRMHGSAESEDPGHGCNGPTDERLSSNGLLKGEGCVVRTCTEENVVVQNGALERDCETISSVEEQEKECDNKLSVNDETDTGLVGAEDGGSDVGLDAGKDCMKENAGDDIGGEVQGTEAVPVLKNSTMNEKSLGGGVTDSLLGRETGVEVENLEVLIDGDQKQSCFEGNYATVGEEQFGDDVEKEDDVGFGIEDGNSPRRDLGESDEYLEQEEDNYATIGGDVDVETENSGSGIENGNLAEGMSVEKKKEKIFLNRFKRSNGGSQSVTSANQPVEEPVYAAVDLSKKKRSRSEKAAGEAKLKVDEVASSDDTEMYYRLDRNRASKSKEGQGQNDDKAMPKGRVSDMSGREETVLIENDIYSQTPPGWQRKGSAADNNRAKNGVSDGAHDGAGSYSDEKQRNTEELDDRLEGEHEEPGYESFEGEDSAATKAVNLNARYHNYTEVDLILNTDDEVKKSKPRVPNFRPEIPPAKQDGGSYVDPDYEAFGNDVPEGGVDPDYASMNNSDKESEEDHYATVGGEASREDQS
ncbi:uncharacterized protein LOC135502105 [Lineus longissimus]|uniref:uncharacterized protein LOC135502105 n=1 Tax=Lineus longissimus TaxID=88925 RepID=UPI00315CB2EE